MQFLKSRAESEASIATILYGYTLYFNMLWYLVIKICNKNKHPMFRKQDKTYALMI